MTQHLEVILECSTKLSLRYEIKRRGNNDCNDELCHKPLRTV